MKKIWISTTALALTLCGFLGASPAYSDMGVKQTVKTPFGSVTLMVMGAEAFSGPDAPMVWDGGAAPVELNGPEHPNHHMVVFLTEEGRPVENAMVEMRYRRSSMNADWVTLPVARMHHAGQGLASTHFGNNVFLENGSYVTEVRVNGSAPISFTYDLMN